VLAMEGLTLSRSSSAPLGIMSSPNPRRLVHRLVDGRTPRSFRAANLLGELLFKSADGSASGRILRNRHPPASLGTRIDAGGWLHIGDVSRGRFRGCPFFPIRKGGGIRCNGYFHQP